VLLQAALVVPPQPATAKGGGGGGGAASVADDDETDTDTDDDEVLNPGKGSGRKPPSHVAIKPEVRLGFRHFLDDAKSFSLEAFVRDQQGILDNPLSLRSSQVSGGLDTAYRFGATTWMVSFQTGEVFSQFYEHTVRTNYQLRTTLQQQIDLGDTDWAIVPRVQAGYQWSSDPTQQRWKFQATVPVSYAISDTLILLPLMPKLSYQPYTDRPDNRADWTLNVSAGIRWVFAKPSFVQASFGYENRWSNVPNAEFSRWVLTPKLNLRVEF
jgi:hypothetical protein